MPDPRPWRNCPTRSLRQRKAPFVREVERSFKRREDQEIDGANQMIAPMVSAA